MSKALYHSIKSKFARAFRHPNQSQCKYHLIESAACVSFREMLVALQRLS